MVHFGHLESINRGFWGHTDPEYSGRYHVIRSYIPICHRDIPLLPFVPYALRLSCYSLRFRDGKMSIII